MGINMDRVKLRGYQIEGRDFLRKTKGAILADPMGVGKTPQAIAAVPTDASFVLVVCPKKVLGVWEEEIGKWRPNDRPIVYHGKGRSHKLASVFNPGSTRWVITTYGTMHELCDIKWPYVVFDEGHRLRNRKTKKWKAAKNISRHATYKWILTGTPIVNRPTDLVPQLMLVRGWPSYWRIVQTHFAIATNTDAKFGPKYEIGQAKKSFKELVSRFVLRRNKAEALPGLPNKVRRKVPIELTKPQRKAYDQLVEEMYLELEDGSILAAPNAVTVATRLRQLLVCPRLIGIDDDGAAVKWLKDCYEDLKDDGMKLVVFTPFKSVLPYLREVLGVKYAITGDTSPSSVKAALQAFADDADCLVSTVQCSEGFSLASSSVAVFLGCDWNASVNQQAEDRLHRHGQALPVNIMYPYSKGTIDEDVHSVLETKNTYSLATLERYLRENHDHS